MVTARKSAHDGAEESGGNNNRGASSATNMASEEEIFSLGAHEAGQEAATGNQGAVLTPGFFELDPSPQNTVQRVLFGANTPQGGGTNFQRIQHLVANAWAGARGDQGGANNMIGGADAMTGGAIEMLGGANTMTAEDNDFMQGMTGTDDNAAARGNNAINLLGGLVGA